MNPSPWPRSDPLHSRLLWIQSDSGILKDLHVEDLVHILGRGDLLVTNDAATLPASLFAHANANSVEIRLAGRKLDGSFRAVILGSGDWHQVTSERPPPPSLANGTRLECGGELFATVVGPSPLSPRLYDLRFNLTGAALYQALYQQGRPVQYWYAGGDLAVWHVQTAYAARPWAMEMPSAGRPLTLPFLRDLKRLGVALSTITHAAGLSATGDEALDAQLPLPEMYEVTAATVAAVAQTRAAGGRVIAVGTSVVRALESAALKGEGCLIATTGETDLHIGPQFKLQVVDALFTGMHETTESHFDLLHAFLPPPVLQVAARHADSEGYLCHEFGDATLIAAAQRPGRITRAA